jgi:2'-5' RNA ligase
VSWEDPGATALVVPALEADPVVGRFRRELTPSGRAGMPPHITLIAPFLRDDALGLSHAREIKEVLAPFRRFRFTLARLERFGTGTLYLAPDPERPFIQMSQALIAAFPELTYPPPRAHRIIPHLTVAAAPGPRLEEIADEVAARLPLEAEAAEVVLMERDQSRRWTTRSIIELGFAP